MCGSTIKTIYQIVGASFLALIIIFILASIIQWVAQKITQHLIKKMIEKEIKKDFSLKKGDVLCFRFKDQLDIGIVQVLSMVDGVVFLKTKWARGWPVNIKNCYHQNVWEYYKKFPVQTMKLLILEWEEQQ